MLAQYVYQSTSGLFRIIRHGHRWRALLDEVEVGRFDEPVHAAGAIRDMYSEARVPARIDRWRFLPDAPLGHLGPPTSAAMARLAAA
ncbi:hypothetical protein EC912_10120 [Luteibacter rhizovicinus]|uniref:Uncharacterized protein n=1 Tax=Luteibacter rhizovicinus TaxID=242606 RepID=A0A4R3YVH4_9GAMM|nr:hypothetical protein [Luteibacter rhizovicinus]TCV97027.1 hypothetical protein EC912_10120 [Luteibacter rhizovicinus]